ncbi:phytanoyl-CoA dioxygenase family protein [Cryptosporangium phraense]|uniref:Phytanoyl-CoA dioxygenase family protein n=1 Tax=Cryptosporangium phraense TaxID=2593070 RepID=A0A545AY60_9ACTN|nr:phytanoyl-CoA dioxygenase family protein [Cryptosporangium phraense]TQS46274.1 phytanoyl-CoA dioxygenase family protein [Cryptosporangium phraense]
MDESVFTPGDGLDAIEASYRQAGFVLLRGLFSDELMAAMEIECADAQRRVLSGELPERYGAAQYLDDASKIERFVNYVQQVQEVSPAVLAAATDPALVAIIHRLIGADAWLAGPGKQGIVYQDARPGKESGYTRIGWHSDWQASPSLDIWPSTAFTFHLDGTSPANGFLRVVPGSHRWATPAPYRNVNNVEVPADAKPAGGYTDEPPPFPMPLGFEKVPGEIGVYADPGDVILHDAYLWHSAARATDDEGIRRHVRSGYFSGDPTQTRDQFLKNAAR